MLVESSFSIHRAKSQGGIEASNDNTPRIQEKDVRQPGRLPDAGDAEPVIAGLQAGSDSETYHVVKQKRSVQMKRLSVFLTLGVALSLLLSACAPATEAPPAPPAATEAATSAAGGGGHQHSGGGGHHGPGNANAYALPRGCMPSREDLRAPCGNQRTITTWHELSAELRRVRSGRTLITRPHALRSFR